MYNYSDRNFTSGTTGLIAVDKVGDQVLFLDPITFVVTSAIRGFAPKVHELLISEDHTRAYVPIYGDGIHGDNPNPGHFIAIIDLEQKRHMGDFSTAPYFAPHCMRWGRNNELYCICENSGVVLQLEPDTGVIKDVIDVGSNKGHRIEILPNGSKLYRETEEDGFLSVIHLQSRRRFKKLTLPSQVDGLGMSPDGSTIIVVDGLKPILYVVDTTKDEVVKTIHLEHFEKAARIARYSPNGNFLVITSHEEPLGTVLNADLSEQHLLQLGKEPMDMAFHPDGRTVLIGNQGDGTISAVDLPDAEVLRTVHAGVGIECLSFY